MSAYDWMGSALCAQTDPALFFSDAKGHNYRDAQAVCAACPVRAQCEEHALRLEGDICQSRRYGAWGGQLPSARAKADGARRENERDRAIARLTEQGESAVAIAQQVGCTSRTVIRVRARQREATA